MLIDHVPEFLVETQIRRNWIVAVENLVQMTPRYPFPQRYLYRCVFAYLSNVKMN